MSRPEFHTNTLKMKSTKEETSVAIFFCLFIFQSNLTATLMNKDQCEHWKIWNFGIFGINYLKMFDVIVRALTMVECRHVLA